MRIKVAHEYWAFFIDFSDCKPQAIVLIKFNRGWIKNTYKRFNFDYYFMIDYTLWHYEVGFCVFHILTKKNVNEICNAIGQILSGKHLYSFCEGCYVCVYFFLQNDLYIILMIALVYCSFRSIITVLICETNFMIYIDLLITFDTSLRTLLLLLLL